MSKADDFRQYADEAKHWARKSKSSKEQDALIDLAHTWAQAAIQSEKIVYINRNPVQGSDI
jgi:hypothetical protein